MKDKQKQSHNTGIQERTWKQDLFTQDIEEPNKPMTPKQKNQVAKWVIVIETILAAFKVVYETLIR